MIQYPAGFGGDVRIKRYLDYYQSGYGTTMLTPLVSAPPAPFTPAALFAAGEQGVWYDPSDFTRYMGNLGSELVSNGDFSGGSTGWSVGTNWSITGGEAVATPAPGLLSQTISITAGKVYKVSFNVRVIVSGTIRVRLGGNTNLVNGILPDGLNTFYLTAENVNSNIAFTSSGAATEYAIDNISVKEVIDISTATMWQDVQGTIPVTDLGQFVGRIRDLSRTPPASSLGPELITNGNFSVGTGWTLGAGWSIASGEATRATNASLTYISQSVTFKGGAAYLVSFDITAISAGGSVNPRFTGGTNTNGTAYSATGSYSQIIVAAVGNTTFNIGCSATHSCTIDNVSVKEILTGNDAFRVTDAARPTLQQDVNGKYYLDFDGTDDGFGTASIDFSGTNKLAVFAGLRKDSDAASGMFVELSATLASNTGVFALQAPGVNASPDYRWNSKGSSAAVATYINAAIAAPVTSVLTGIASIPDDVCTLRLNGSQVLTSATDQGTGNYGNHPMYVGSRSNSSLRFNGRLYSLIVLGREATTQEISDTETWVNNETGAY